MREIVHHQSPTSVPLLPPTRDFEGVGSGVTAFQTTVSDDNTEGKALERFVTTNKITRASRLFRSRRAASLGRGLRKSRKVRFVFVIVSVQRDHARVVADQKPDAYHFRLPIRPTGRLSLNFLLVLVPFALVTCSDTRVIQSSLLVKDSLL